MHICEKIFTKFYFVFAKKREILWKSLRNATEHVRIFSRNISFAGNPTQNYTKLFRSWVYVFVKKITWIIIDICNIEVFYDRIVYKVKKGINIFFQKRGFEGGHNVAPLNNCSPLHKRFCTPLNERNMWGGISSPQPTLILCNSRSSKNNSLFEVYSYILDSV